MKCRIIKIRSKTDTNSVISKWNWGLVTFNMNVDLSSKLKPIRIYWNFPFSISNRINHIILFERYFVELVYDFIKYIVCRKTTYDLFWLFEVWIVWLEKKYESLWKKRSRHEETKQSQESVKSQHYDVDIDQIFFILSTRVLEDRS